MGKEQQQQLIDETFGTLRRGYYLWYLGYIVLGISSIVLPALAAIGVWPQAVGQILAGAGAVVSAVFVFLKPNEYASGFNEAKQRVWRAKIGYSLGTLDEHGVDKEISEALKIITYRYAGVANTKGQGLPEQQG